MKRRSVKDKKFISVCVIAIVVLSVAATYFFYEKKQAKNLSGQHTKSEKIMLIESSLAGSLVTMYMNTSQWIISADDSIIRVSCREIQEQQLSVKSIVLKQQETASDFLQASENFYSVCNEVQEQKILNDSLRQKLLSVIFPLYSSVAELSVIERKKTSEQLQEFRLLSENQTAAASYVFIVAISVVAFIFYLAYKIINDSKKIIETLELASGKERAKRVELSLKANRSKKLLLKFAVYISSSLQRNGMDNEGAQKIVSVTHDVLDVVRSDDEGKQEQRNLIDATDLLLDWREDLIERKIHANFSLQGHGAIFVCVDHKKFRRFLSGCARIACAHEPKKGMAPSPINVYVQKNADVESLVISCSTYIKPRHAIFDAANEDLDLDCEPMMGSLIVATDSHARGCAGITSYSQDEFGLFTLLAKYPMLDSTNKQHSFSGDSGFDESHLMEATALVAILEPNPGVRAKLAGLLESIHTPFNIIKIDDDLEHIVSTRFNGAILDIGESQSGLAFAVKLRDKGFDAPIWITSPNVGQAINEILSAGFHVIEKPIKSVKFKEISILVRKHHSERIEDLLGFMKPK